MGILEKAISEAGILQEIHGVQEEEPLVLSIFQETNGAQEDEEFNLPIFQEDEMEELLQIWNMEEPEIPLQSQQHQNITVNDLATSSSVLVDDNVRESSLSYFETISPPPTIPIVKISQRLLIQVEEVERYFHLHELVKKNAARALCSYLKYNKTGINDFDDAGRTPAMLSILCQHHNCLLVLINFGIDINKQDVFGNTVLHLAAKTNDQVSLILLKSNLQANFKLLNKIGEPPAFSAFESLDNMMVELAWNLTINKRFITNQTDLFGLTYLHKAASESNLQAIENFIKSVGAHRTIKCTHVEKQTPLHFACREGNFECFKKILHFQPSAVYIPDKNGCLPIHLVKNVEILKYFINFDHTMIKEKNKVNYRSLIHYVAEANLYELIILIFKHHPNASLEIDLDMSHWESLASPETVNKVEFLMGWKQISLM